MASGIKLHDLINHLENLEELNDGDGDIPVTIAIENKKTKEIDLIAVPKLANVRILRKENLTAVYLDPYSLLQP